MFVEARVRISTIAACQSRVSVCVAAACGRCLVLLLLLLAGRLAAAAAAAAEREEGERRHLCFIFDFSRAAPSNRMRKSTRYLFDRVASTHQLAHGGSLLFGGGSLSESKVTRGACYFAVEVLRGELSCYMEYACDRSL